MWAFAAGDEEQYCVSRILIVTTIAAIVVTVLCQLYNSYAIDLVSADYIHSFFGVHDMRGNSSSGVLDGSAGRTMHRLRTSMTTRFGHSLHATWSMAPASRTKTMGSSVNSSSNTTPHL